MQGWCSQGWFCLTGFIKHIQDRHRTLQNLHRAFTLDTKKRKFFPQVLYLDILCVIRIWLSLHSSRNQKLLSPWEQRSLELGRTTINVSGHSGPISSQDFHGTSKPSVLGKSPQGCWGSSLMTFDMPYCYSHAPAANIHPIVVQNKNKNLVCRTAILSAGQLGTFQSHPCFASKQHTLP